MRWKSFFYDTIEADKKSLAYAQSQYQTGITDKIAVVEATNTVQSAEATATNLGVLRGAVRARHRGPDRENRLETFAVPTRILTATPPRFPSGSPPSCSSGVRMLPAAERQMAAANRPDRHGRSRLFSQQLP